jgi:hypothetical protein
MIKTYRFRQIRIDRRLYLRIKHYCISHDKKISEFFEEILSWYVNQLRPIHPITYQACRQEDYLMTIRISNRLAETVDEIAKQEKISAARIVSTALTLYLKDNQI